MGSSAQQEAVGSRILTYLENSLFHLLVQNTSTPNLHTMTSIAGDWEMVTDKCPVPVKVTLAELPGMWLLAAMIPKGNMIQCMLRREGDSFHLEKLHMTEKESPIEIVEMEMEMSRFLKKGVTKITRDGDSLTLEVSDGSSLIFQVDLKGRERLGKV